MYTIVSPPVCWGTDGMNVICFVCIVAGSLYVKFEKQIILWDNLMGVILCRSLSKILKVALM